MNKKHKFLAEPNPTHYKIKNSDPNPTQPNPWVNPTHVHLCATMTRCYSSPKQYILTLPLRKSSSCEPGDPGFTWLIAVPMEVVDLLDVSVHQY